MRPRNVGSLLQICAAALIASCPGITAAAQSPAANGRVDGVVTATGPNAQTIKAAHVLVQMWRADATTSAARDSACSAWLADKNAWLQATEEVESPSGVSLTGTRVGQDVNILHSLYALRSDTVRTGDDGAFTFADVPPGAYTVVAETFAGDKFLQWNADVGVLPKFTTRADLGANSLAENQYCAQSSADSADGRIYDSKDLDQPLRPLGRYGSGSQEYPVVHGGRLEVSYVVNENGVPDLETVTVKSTGANFSVAEAREFVSKLRFSPPTVHGRPVKARDGFVVQAIMTAH